MDSIVITVLVVAFAILFDLTNGWNDSANAIATVVSTRVMSPLAAVLFGSALNFTGALFSTEVAKTVGRDIADPALLTQSTFLAAVMVAPLWITYCTRKGLPISCSHSLMGALIGSVIASAGANSLESKGVSKIVFGVFTSPVIGFAAGFIVIVLIYWLCRRWRPSTVDRLFGKIQILSAGAMAFSHGTGDAQKAMGVVTGALITGEYLSLEPNGEMLIPLWVRIACASAMGIGTAAGGWIVIRTLGSRLAHLKPHHGFAAECAGSATILANTLSGIPISTTHSITGAIMGVVSARGVKAVKWGIGKKIIFAWIFTFPVCIIGGAAAYKLLRLIGI